MGNLRRTTGRFSKHIDVHQILEAAREKKKAENKHKQEEQLAQQKKAAYQASKERNKEENATSKTPAVTPTGPDPKPPKPDALDRWDKFWTTEAEDLDASPSFTAYGKGAFSRLMGRQEAN